MTTAGLAVALLIKESREGRREGRKWKNQTGLRLLLPPTCKNNTVAPYARASSHAVART
jgi:hypothetical protein